MDLPVEWSAGRNIAWKTALSGMGASTPIIFGDLVFLTSQLGDGPFAQGAVDFYGASAARRMGSRAKVQFAVQAFSRQTGKLAWEYKFDAEGPLPDVHIKHNLASPSCVTDGRLVYAWMGNGQLVALDMSGKLVWKRHLGKEFGPFEILWGHGSSPVLYKDSLILLCDHQGAAYLLSLDKRTGAERWKVDRGGDRRAYSTPFLIPGDQIVINSSERIDVFDAATGAPLWHIGEPNTVPVPTPVFHDGVLYVNRGYSSSPYMAIRTAASPKLEWEVPGGAPYVSSLLYYDGLLYMATEMGIASAVDAASGKLLWRERFGGVFSASPVAAGGKIYLINEEGLAFVLQAGRELKILHKNQLGERVLASPAISDGRIFLRSDEHLICIGKR
jgi:outer membrane protein assembly factor BamB